MIRSLGDKATEDFFHGRASAKARKLDNAVDGAGHRKLDMLNAATKLDDLSNVPGNRLEKLKGDLVGYFSIRIYDQWRVIFKWSDASTAADSVQIVDYH